MIHTLSSDKLVTEIKDLVKRERLITKELIERISEVDRRNLYLARGYSSLFAWMCEELGYSPSSAQRRIEAARLLQRVPEVAEKVASGSLSLTTVSRLQSALRLEAKKEGQTPSLERTRDLVSKVEARPAPEAEKILLQEIPVAVPKREVLREASSSETRLSLTLTETQLADLKRARELLSHSHPEGSWAEIIGHLAEAYLKAKDPLRKKLKASDHKPLGKTLKRVSPSLKREHQAASISTSAANAESCQDGEVQSAEPRLYLTFVSPDSKLVTANRSKNPRFIPALTRRQVFQRDRGRCTFKDAVTGRTCGSSHRVQIDHIQPVSLDGGHEITNLRLLCAAHNRMVFDRLSNAGHRRELRGLKP